MSKISVLYVCLGNICRSPMAEFVLKDLVAKRGWADRFLIDSAGTSGWHNGEDMHIGTKKVLQKNGIACSGFVSSRVAKDALDKFDYLIAMDDDNLQNLNQLFGHDTKRIFKLTDFAPELGYDFVPDPWYSGNFDEVYHIVTIACNNWLDSIK